MPQLLMKTVDSQEFTIKKLKSKTLWFYRQTGQVEIKTLYEIIENSDLKLFKIKERFVTDATGL